MPTRVCIIDASERGAVFPRPLGSEDLVLVGQIPRLERALLPASLLETCDVIVVEAGNEELGSAAFRAELSRLSLRHALVLVVPGATQTEVAMAVGARGLVAREAEPEALSRVVRAVASGELAYPRGALSEVVSAAGRPVGRGARVSDAAGTSGPEAPNQVRGLQWRASAGPLR